MKRMREGAFIVEERCQVNMIPWQEELEATWMKMDQPTLQMMTQQNVLVRVLLLTLTELHIGAKLIFIIFQRIVYFILSLKCFNGLLIILSRHEVQ